MENNYRAFMREETETARSTIASFPYSLTKSHLIEKLLKLEMKYKHVMLYLTLYCVSK